MTKQEFLEGLETALAGQVSRQVLLENMQYYAGYIEDEVRKGRREADVMEELGSPNLIARTIIDTEGNGEEGPYAGGVYEEETVYSEDGRQDGPEQYGGFRIFHTGSNGCLWIALAAVLILFLVLFLVMRFIYAFPGLILLGIVAYLIYTSRGRRF